jgi:hypothetical protein
MQYRWGRGILAQMKGCLRVVFVMDQIMQGAAVEVDAKDIEIVAPIEAQGR